MARVEQLLLAFVFLTRVPLGGFLPARVLPIRESLWAFPIVGAVVGAVASVPLLIFGHGLLPAALSVTLAVWLTGALHEDGLADFADAGGGRDSEDRLRIMRDSHIGSYGVLALLLVTAMRIVAVAQIGPWQLIAAACGGRAAIVIAMRFLTPARSDGLGHDAGRAPWSAVVVASVVAGAVLLNAGPAAPLSVVFALIAFAAVLWQARRWIGGQTGDVLGTCAVIVETAMLIAFAL